MRRFTVQGTNEAFICSICGVAVQALTNGSVRNHCPECLWSLHVDVFPGDRASECGGRLEPVAVEQHPKKGWVIVHQCQVCGEHRRNKAALNDPQQPDRYEALVALSSGAYEGIL